jgi:hypothetical protein
MWDTEERREVSIHMRAKGKKVRENENKSI